MSISLEFDCDDDAERQAIKQQYIEILRPSTNTGNYGAGGAATDVQVILENLPPLRFLNLAFDTVRMNGLARVLLHSGKQLVKLLGPSDSKKLRGDHQDYLLLLEAIRNLPNIKDFSWNAISYSTTLDLDSEVLLTPTNDSVVLNNADGIVQAILQSGAALNSLGLFSCPTDSSLQCLLDRCKTTLEDLVLKRLGSHRVVKVLSKFLSREDCHLHAVDITLNISLAREFVNTLKSCNNKLMFLAIQFHTGNMKDAETKTETQNVMKQMYLNVADALKTNKYLCKFCCYPKPPYLHMRRHASLLDVPTREQITAAFVETLHENTTLIHLELDFEVSPMIDYYLDLNSVGRKRVIENGHAMTRQQWVTELAHQSNSHDWLYFVLQSNPLLCHGGEDTIMVSTTATGKRKHDDVSK